MRRQPFIAPELWVMPRDLILRTEADTLAHYLAEKAGCETRVLDGDSLAYSFRDVLVDRGTSLDYPKFLERTRLVRELLSGLVARGDALGLDIPDNKYWITMCLCEDESEKRECCYMKSTLEQWEPFAFIAAAPFPLKPSVKNSLRAFLENWIARMSSEGSQGELLNLGKVEIHDHLKPANSKSYPWDGFVITCSSYTLCTWPWLEWYLSMRKHFPPRQRLSLEFFNPPNAPKWL